MQGPRASAVHSSRSRPQNIGLRRFLPSLFEANEFGTARAIETVTTDPTLPSHIFAQPTPVSTLVFACKANAFRARRSLVNLFAGPHKLRVGSENEFREVVALSDTPLWSDEAQSEHALQLGKVQNLRTASRLLDGLVIPAEAVFSFWRHVGSPRAGRGFVLGRMLKQGCIMPVTGGGLCQLSNALYAIALEAGCRIVERHPHSRLIPNSIAAPGHDATVAWNYVDLRFAPQRDLRLAVRMDRTRLTVALTARPNEVPVEEAISNAGASIGMLPKSAGGCDSCGETRCYIHRREARTGAKSRERRAFLVDEAWPEFQDYVRSVRQPEDWLGLPFSGIGLRLARYRWAIDGFDRTFDVPVEAVARSLAVRLAKPGSPRRKAELASAQVIANKFARRLAHDVTAVTVAQSLLPFLWRDGHLGGREVNVLMTRLPSAILHQRLDAAFAAHPERATLSDFRWPEELVGAEAEALKNATRIITPHAEIAGLFGGRAVKLPWARDVALGAPRQRPIRCIAFPGPTIARKGAYAVRDAARALDLDVMLFGAQLEGSEFWSGVRTRFTRDWTEVDAVVQPAWTEEQPRRLLEALALGIPVFATSACGLEPRPGISIIPPDDSSALINNLKATSSPSSLPATLNDGE